MKTFSYALSQKPPKVCTPRNKSVADFSVHVRQVLSTQQVAGVMVHAYPFLPILVKTLDAVAARGGVQDLRTLPAVFGDPEQLAAEWGQFEAYVARIQTQVWHDYVPLVVSSGQDELTHQVVL